MTDPQMHPVLKGGVVRNDIRSSPPGFWDKVASGFGKVAHYAKGALPYLAEAASAFENSSSVANSSSGTGGDFSSSLTYQSTLTNNSSQRTGKPVTARQIQVKASPAIGSQAVERIANQRTQVSKETIRQSYQKTVNVLGEFARSQGLPTYPEFHRKNGVAHDVSLPQGGLGFANIQAAQKAANASQSRRYNQSGNETNAILAQHMENLRNAQAQVLETQRQAAIEVQNKRLWHINWSKQKAAELRQRYASKSYQQSQTASPSSTKSVGLTAKVTYQQYPRSVEHYALGKQGPLTDADIKQFFHALDIEAYKAQNVTQKQNAERHRYEAYRQIANNILRYAKQDAQGQVYINTVAVPANLALDIAWRDVQHFDRTDTHLTPAQTQKIVDAIGESEPGLSDFTTPVVIAAVAPRILGPLGKALFRLLIAKYAASQAAKRIITFEARQLQKKYSKHALDVGFTKKYSPKNAEEFMRWVTKFVKNPQTKEVIGTYRKTIPTKTYYNPNTRLTVITSRDGKFISIWESSIEQIENLLRTGNIQ
jgi:hypothetical protein